MVESSSGSGSGNHPWLRSSLPFEEWLGPDLPHFETWEGKSRDEFLSLWRTASCCGYYKGFLRSILEHEKRAGGVRRSRGPVDLEAEGATAFDLLAEGTPSMMAFVGFAFFETSIFCQLNPMGGYTSWIDDINGAFFPAQDAAVEHVVALLQPDADPHEMEDLKTQGRSSQLQIDRWEMLDGWEVEMFQEEGTRYFAFPVFRRRRQ